MSRKYKSWNGLSLVTLVGLVLILSLVFLLVKGFIVSMNMVSLMVILIILLVVGVAYANYLTLQLRKRNREFYLRKLLGARDVEILFQILLESTVLTSFIVVSGMVVAELISPWFGQLLGVSLVTESLSISLQILIVIVTIVPVGILSVLLPIKSYIGYIKKNITNLSNKAY